VFGGGLWSALSARALSGGQKKLDEDGMGMLVKAV
jgi:hypothetical protein